jgi:ribonuclease III
MDKKRLRKLKELSRIININFDDYSILERALIHSSYVNEKDRNLTDNECMEFLGDAILNLVVCEFLYTTYKDQSVGNLTKIKSHVVSAEVLSTISKKIKLGEFIMLGKGEELSNGREKPSLLANTLEALLAAIYLDCGMDIVKRFIIHLFRGKIEKSNKTPHKYDFKSKFQEYALESLSELPEYKILQESGPSHDKKFKIGLILQNELIGVGSGKTKKEAQQNAARIALDTIYKQNKSVEKEG